MVEVRLEVGMGTMLGLWFQATGKELTEKVRMEIKKGGDNRHRKFLEKSERNGILTISRQFHMNFSELSPTY